MPAFDGPYEVRVFYTVAAAGIASLEHRCTFDVSLSSDPAPGTAPAEVIVENKDGSDVAFSSFIDTFTAIAKLQFNVNTTFSRAELWRSSEGSHDFQFITAYSFSVAGTSANPINLAHQQTYTFRSTNGGIMRIQLMETVSTFNGSVAYASAGAGEKAFMDYIVSSTKPFLARDNGRPYASNRVSGGQNEKLFRKRFRPT